MPVDELIPQVERIYRALVHLQFVETDPATRRVVRYEAATGFLVRLGGCEFVFTAKHNLDGETPSTTGLQIPRELTIPVHVGQGVGLFLRAEGDEDAAVVELNPDERWLWQSAVPFEHHELGAVAEARAARALCLSGFPVAQRRTQPGPPGMDSVQQFQAAMQLVDEVPEHRPTHGPPEGRGIYVRYGGRAYDHTLKAWRDVPSPKGMSGGPLVAIGDNGVRVLGIARSIENDVEWCEPAIECARLLVRHRVPEVAAEASAVLRAAQDRS